MANYKAMYLELFNKVSDVISELQKIQLLTEEMNALSDDTDTTSI